MFRALACLLSLFVCNSAYASIDKAAVEKFGLIGHWAQNCVAKPTVGNWHLDYKYDPQGNIVRRMYRDNDERFSTIQKIKQLDGESIFAHEIYGEGWKDYKGVGKDYVLVFSKDFKSYRSLASELSTGKSFIYDGKKTYDGSEAPSIYKCES